MNSWLVPHARRVLMALCLLAGTTANAQMTVTSPAFANNGVIPDPFTYSIPGQCNGQNWSPPLEIGNIPTGTQTLAIRLVDPDGGDWMHWKAWDIPVPAGASSVSLPYNAAASFPAGTQAANDFGPVGYGGPCPPTPNHHYVFSVFALAATAGAGEPVDAALDALPSTHKGSLVGIRSPGDSLPWTPSGEPGPAPVVTSVPTLSEIGIVLMGLLMLGVVFFSGRRML